jgi:cytochrome c
MTAFVASRAGALAIVAALIGLPAAAHADGDPAKGEIVFKKCAACHEVGPDAKAKVGPPLTGVVGRKWGAVEGYAYSKPEMAGAAEGKVWDDATLDAYLEAPKKIIPGGKMAFAGLKKPEDRADVIAYLATFK